MMQNVPYVQKPNKNEAAKINLELALRRSPVRWRNGPPSELRQGFGGAAPEKKNEKRGLKHTREVQIYYNMKAK